MLDIIRGPEYLSDKKQLIFRTNSEPFFSVLTRISLGQKKL